MKARHILLNTFFGIGIASIIFFIIGISIDASLGGKMSFSGYSFTKMAAAALAIGVGFGAPAAIYEDDRLSLPMQALIHIGIGCTVLIIAGFAAGWLSAERGAASVVLTILGQLAVALAIWFGFYRHQKRIAEKMNKQIEAKRKK